MKTQIYVISGVIIGIVLFFLFNNFSEDKYNIVDIYTDSTSNGKYIFIFTETKSTDSIKMLNFAKEIKFKDNLLDMPDKTQASILTMYFYNPKDTLYLDNDVLKSLQGNFKNNPKILERINFIKDGWQYIGHNDKTLTSFARDTIYKSLVFVPKPGFKARDIISIGKGEHND